MIAKEISKSFGFALINGAIAAIAVAPHIAVPDAIKIASFWSIFNTLAIKMPTKKVIITKPDMYGKYFDVK